MAESHNGTTLYASRFTKAQAAGLKAINDSLPVDRRMYDEDIVGSMAHARMLGRQGIIPPEDMSALEAQGTGKLFGPGTPTSDLIKYIQEWAAEHVAA